MLHTEVLSKAALDLLRTLLGLPELIGYHLVGGTALALQIGHRRSLDIDLFGPAGISAPDLIQKLSSLGCIEERSLSEKIMQLSINGLRVDIVEYPYATIAPPIMEEGIRMLAKPDIAAMKIAAISSRGAKKDFYDVFYLAREFSLRRLLDFYSAKFPSANRFHALKSLSYFEDAEADPEPQCFEPIDWIKVKSSLAQEVRSLATEL